MKRRPSIPTLATAVVLSWSVAPSVCWAEAGDLDPTFGVGGKVMTDFAANFDVANALAIQADGKIVVVGRAASLSVSEAALARYDPDGTLDASFGSGGLVTTPVGTGVSEWLDVAMQADGGIVTAGVAFTSGSYNFTVARYLPSGMLDASFDTDGVATTPFPPGAATIGGLVIQADGKIVVAGQLFVGAGRDFALMRYTPNGMLDPGFGTGGIVTTSFPGSGDEEALSVAIQADGKIVAAGRADSATRFAEFALARYNANGSLDATFGSGGRVVTDFATSADIANDVVILADGKILAVGQTYRSAVGFDFALARYNPDGSPDTGFGTSGLVASNVGSPTDIAYAVAIQPDGKPVVAGRFGFGSTTDDFVLARYNQDGRLDGGFGTLGVVTTDFASRSDEGHDVALQSDGRIVVAGVANFGGSTGPDFAVARYEGISTPDELIADLMDLVQSFDLPGGIETALLVKLEAAQEALDAADTAAACAALKSFIYQVKALAGKKLTIDQASQLLALAFEVRALLDCP
jgi:uncharacterized delta-60 repeat protein